MLSKDKMTVAMGALRDQFIVVLQQHENEAHHGQACMGNRASAIASLMHCVAMRNTREMWKYLRETLKEYEEHCPDCPHGKV